MPRRPCLVILISLVLALAAACRSEQSTLVGERGEAIVGGTVSPAGYLPAVGALAAGYWGFYEIFCTATLVSERLLVTAAHCVDSAGLPPGAAIGFYTGNNIHSGNPTSQIIPIASVTPHPKYTGGTPPGQLADYYDIAVVKLSQPTTIPPMKMIRPKELGLIKIGTQLTIVGYGQSLASDPNSAGVKKSGPTSLDMVGGSEIMISGSAQTCHGDSGGPTLANAGSSTTPDYRIIGVTSRGAETCDIASVETRVDAYLTWIHSFGTIPCGSGLSADCGVTPTPDAAPPPALLELGQPCTVATECKGGLCIVNPAPGGSGLVCSQACDVASSTCPAGYTCRAIAGTSGGACVQGAATPPKKAMGESCAANDECEGGLCASQGDTRFCTRLCTLEQGCGDTMACVATGDQYACAPKADPPAQGGGGCSFGAARAATSGAVGGLGGLLLLLALLARRR